MEYSVHCKQFMNAYDWKWATEENRFLSLQEKINSIGEAVGEIGKSVNELVGKYPVAEQKDDMPVIGHLHARALADKFTALIK